MKKSTLDLRCLLLSIILMSGLLSNVIGYALNITANSNFYILLVEATLCFVIFLQHEELKFRVNFLFIYLFGYILILFTLSYLRNQSLYTIPQFLFFCILPLFVSCKEFDAKKVLEYCMYISLLSIPFLGRIFSLQYEGINQISMGSSYSISVSIIAAMIHRHLYKKECNLKIKMVYIYQFFLFFKLLSVATRGVILSLIVTIIFLKLSKFNSSDDWNVKSPKYIIKLAFFSVCTIIILLNLEIILTFLYNLCNKLFGVSISFLSKSILLLKKGNLSNGRNMVYEVAFSLIPKKLFFGYGIRNFALYSSEPWPHNLFIQLIFDGGIFFAIVPIILILIFSIKVMNSNFENKNSYAISLFLFLMVFPRLLLSNDIWLTPFLWCMLGFCSCYFYRKKEIRNEKENL